MKVLITGGAGYVGTGLIYSLINESDIEEIVIFDNLSRPNFNLFIGHQKLDSSKLRFVNAEILDSRSLKKALDGIDVVYHLAAKVTTPFADENPHLFEQVNHWGTAELIYAIEESDSVKKLVYLSSTSVYGSTTGKKSATVETAPNPKTFYGISKMRGEDHVKRLANKMPVYIFRCGNVYGYNKSMRFDSVINRFMFDANFVSRIQLNGKGSQSRPFIHIDKASEVLANVISSDLESGVYNLIDKNLSIIEISEHINELYPDMEMLFVNQHLTLRELTVDRDTRLDVLIKSKSRSLKEELDEFKEKFSFQG
jgi:UDP-glucose 4-epimerase